MPLAEELETLIDSSTSERPILKWLKQKKNACILPLAVKMFRLGKYVVPEFNFGTDYRADFVVMGPFSGGFDIQFIEIEPPNVPLFTRAEIPAKRFAGALAQVRDWKAYVEKNRDIVLKELAKSAEKKALLRNPKDSFSPRSPYSLLSPWHPEAGFNWGYHIVIGRRTSLSEEHLGKKASFHSTDSVEVMTYDRLIDAAKAWDTDKGEHAEYETPWRRFRGPEELCSEDLYYGPMKDRPIPQSLEESS
jgi:Domain of unknown function (DUF4263)